MLLHDLILKAINTANISKTQAEFSAQRMPDPLFDQARLTALAINQAGKAAVRFARRTPLSRWVSGIPAAYHLLILPQDLRTGDPSFAVELYDGYFGLAGAVALTGSESPFGILPPTLAWQTELYAFSWLRHLHASGDQIAREKARNLTSEWAGLGRKAPAIASDTDVTARRVIALLSHAAFLLDGAEPDFYELVMRVLSRDLHDLTVTLGDAASGVAKLRAMTALLLAGLCVAEQQSLHTGYEGNFCAELERQILEDGGHVSRDPRALIELLLDLLPLKQCFVARQIDPPEALYAALNRMLTLLRFLRLGDGSLAHFNGMGPTPVDQIATVLAYDDIGAMYAEPLSEKSRYARLHCGQTIVLADCGPPPPMTASARAHAGCAAFEMSIEHEPLIVNCGTPQDETSDWYIVSRSTSAHSTLSINDLSSARLIKAQLPQKTASNIFWLSGPRNVRAEVQEQNAAKVLRVVHDGYRDRFGLLHKRRLALSADGSELEGQDQLISASSSSAAPPASKDAAFAVRFHLHPRVKAALARNSNAVILTLPSGQSWRFSAAKLDLNLEESIFFADPICLRRSLQIVLKGRASANATIDWKLEKIGAMRKISLDGQSTLAVPGRTV